MSVRLETHRLVIRSFTEADGNSWLKLVNDPDVSRYTPDTGLSTLEDFSGALARRRGLEQERGFAMWAVELRDAGEFIGQCGLYLAEGKGPEIELAYHFLPVNWGKGFATEAAMAVLGRGFGVVGLDEAIAVVIPDNVGSARVAEKAGMRRVSDNATYYGIPRLMKYAADRRSWLAAHAQTDDKA
jgi:RimJ/RimL family protein N-acetyltransferase